MKELLEKLINRKDLTAKEVQAILDSIVQGELNNSQIAAFLTALRIKGESVDEIVGLIEGMRKHMVRLQFKGNAIDTCGTGGDGKGTFNVSTAAAFVVAGAGIQVAKHGNRAASSKCGSADVLEALGVNINLSPQQASDVLKKVGMVFLFAPLYHPAMKHIGPIRKELGFRTVFNYLGPFLSPAGVKRQLIGVPSVAIAQKLARVAAKLGYKHLFLVTSDDGMDEISINKQTTIFEIKGSRIIRKKINPKAYGFGSETVPNGGDPDASAKTLMNILLGKKGAARDMVVLNSACALYVAGKVKTVKEGILLAEKAIDSGSAKQTLENLRKETQKYA